MISYSKILVHTHHPFVTDLMMTMKQQIFIESQASIFLLVLSTKLFIPTTESLVTQPIKTSHISQILICYEYGLLHGW